MVSRDLYMKSKRDEILNQLSNEILEFLDIEVSEEKLQMVKQIIKESFFKINTLEGASFSQKIYKLVDEKLKSNNSLKKRSAHSSLFANYKVTLEINKGSKSDEFITNSSSKNDEMEIEI